MKTKRTPQGQGSKPDWPALRRQAEDAIGEELRSLVAVLVELDGLLSKLEPLGRVGFHTTVFEMRTRLEGVRDGLRLAGLAERGGPAKEGG